MEEGREKDKGGKRESKERCKGKERPEIDC